MKQRYREAHREARKNARDGLWLRNPVRFADGWPGLFVSADGTIRHCPDIWAPSGELFPEVNAGRRFGQQKP